MARKKQSNKNTIPYAFVLIDFWAPNSNFKDKKYNRYECKYKKYSHNDKSKKRNELKLKKICLYL